MTRIKICGITRAEDAKVCAELGADFVGFVFVKESPRYVAPEKAREITQVRGRVSSEGEAPHPNPLPTAVRLRRGEGTDFRGLLFVGVFRDAPLHEIHRIAAIAQLDVIQLHGNESDDFVRAIELPVIKALNVQHALPDTTSSADWLMFDSGGGTGRAFDWSLLASYPRTKPFFLAGGLTPDNVEDAIGGVRPDAIDLSSGVESAPGIKDHDKLRELFERVKRT